MGICAVLMVDAVTTNEANCNTCIGLFRSLQWLAVALGQGYSRSSAVSTDLRGWTKVSRVMWIVT